MKRVLSVAFSIGFFFASSANATNPILTLGEALLDAAAKYKIAWKTCKTSADEVWGELGKSYDTLLRSQTDMTRRQAALYREKMSLLDPNLSKKQIDRNMTLVKKIDEEISALDKAKEANSADLKELYKKMYDNKAKACDTAKDGFGNKLKELPGAENLTYSQLREAMLKAGMKAGDKDFDSGLEILRRMRDANKGRNMYLPPGTYP